MTADLIARGLGATPHETGRLGLPRVAAYRPTIVWGTGTGIDTSEFDDVGGYALGDPGLAIDGIGRDQARAYSPPRATALDLVLSNHDGRFSPGGPLALFLGRGPAVTVDADWGVDVLVDSPYVLVDDPRELVDGAPSIRLFTGTSVYMPQRIDLGQYAVSVTAVGTLQSLVTTRPTTILYENIRTDEAIAVLLDAAGWDADARSLDTGDTQLLFWWLGGQTTAMDALNAILMAEGAGSCAYEDGDGVFHFEGRQFRDNNPRSQTVQWACFDSARTDGLVPNALTYVAPSEYRSNPDEVVVSVAATVNTRTPTAVQKVWEYGGPLALTSSQVLDIQVTASDPFKDAITPRDGTDYTITAGSALVGISLLTTSGQVATLRLTAPAGGCTVAGVTSNGIQVRATSLPVASSQTVTSTLNTALSTARQGSPNNPLVLGCWPEIERNQTLDLVNSMLLRYQRERRQITFSLVNVDAIHQYAMFNIRPSDRVHFYHEHAQLNADFWVETVDYAISIGGLMRLTLGCEQVFDLSGGRFDAAHFDVDVFGT